LPGGLPAGLSPVGAWFASGSICAAEPHVHRLEPLHAAGLTLLPMQNGVPMALAPVGPAGRAAATTAGRGARCCCPGGPIEPEVLAYPHRTLRAHRAVWIATTGEPLAAAHLGGRASGKQFLLVELPQQGFDLQAPRLSTSAASTRLSCCRRLQGDLLPRALDHVD
jgi:hypothetical protein